MKHLFRVSFLCFIFLGACGPRVVVQAPPVVEAPLMNLFGDPRASRLGDLVTVQIIENSRGSRKVSSLAEKESDLAANVKTVNAGKQSNSNLGVKITNDTNAESGLERRGTLVAAVTARVTELMPEGNLRIEGRQEILLEKGLQTISVKGILRPADIGPGNTVLSSRLADARIEYRSRKEPGVHNQGLLAWLFGWIF